MPNPYFSTGISIEQTESGRWRVYADFLDGLFAFTRSTEGRMRVRYEIETDEIVDAVKNLKEDMESLGIKFHCGEIGPTIYYPGDSVSSQHADIIEEICKDLGWRNIYQRQE